MATRRDSKKPGKPAPKGPPKKAQPRKGQPKKAAPKKAQPKKDGPKSGPKGSGRGRASGGPGQGRGSGSGRSRTQGSAPRVPSSRRARGLKVTADVTAPVPEVTDDGRMRLNRFLAAAGVCSRRAADQWIEEGRVEVNGERVTELGVRIDPDADDVRYMGERVRLERPTYVLFNKPRGVLCTNANNEPRRRVLDFLGKVRGRLYTVGRLDADSEGLILVTNDGQFAQALAHPSHGVPKQYAVLLRGSVEQDDLKKARGGVWLAEGRTGGADIRVERRGRDRTYLKVTIREGRNREIRRVFARLGYPVISLKRIRIGNLSLHGLGAGKFRFLSRPEVDDLLHVARQDDAGE